ESSSPSQLPVQIAALAACVSRPHRLEAQDTALSRLKHGFESRWGHHLETHVVTRAFGHIGHRAREFPSAPLPLAVAILKLVRAVKAYLFSTSERLQLCQGLRSQISLGRFVGHSRRPPLYR